MAKLTDREIHALAEKELQSATGAWSSELSEERSDALDYYLGEPYGDEREGRSQVRTREVLDTVEWILPSLIRIFSDIRNIAEFKPIGPEDEDAAKQESEACSHVFWAQNRGFHNLYTAAKDALLSKTGILKVWWDDAPEEEREEYEGLNALELAQLVFDQSVEREVLDFNVGPEGVDVTFQTTRSKGKICIEPVPPEEFGISKEAWTPYVADAPFCYHRVRKTKAQLVEEGYDRKLVERLPTSDGMENEEQLARRHLDDERVGHLSASHWSMHQIWVTEAYMHVDRNDDGIAEILKVTLAGGPNGVTSGSTMLDIEEVDAVPFFAWAPVVLTHKFIGLSMADLVMDLQRIRSTLMRGVVDATYLANNPRTAANRRVNLEDLMTSRPGGVVRTEGEEPPQNHLYPIPVQAPPPETFALLEYLEEMRKHRTGVGDEVAALESNSLAHVNTGVAALAYDAARSKIELIARIMGEYMVRPLWLRIHELLRKKSEDTLSLQLSGEWVDINPAEWRQRTDLRLQVGIGRASKERRLVALNDIMEKQVAVVQGGGLGVLVAPEHMHNAVTEYTECLGEEPTLYWMDPAMAPPQQPKPDATMMALELQAHIENGKLQLEREKIQSNAYLKGQEMVQRQEETAIKAHMEQTKSELAVHKQLVDEKSQVLSANADMLKTQSDAVSSAVNLKLEEMRIALEALNAERDRYQRHTQAEMEAAVDLAKAGADTSQTTMQRYMDIDERQQRLLQDYDQSMEAMGGRLQEMHALIQELSKPKPKRVVRDDQGRIVQIGEQRVVRDLEGNVLGLE